MYQENSRNSKKSSEEPKKTLINNQIVKPR